MVYFGAHMTWMRKDERKNEDLSVGGGDNYAAFINGSVIPDQLFYGKARSHIEGTGLELCVQYGVAFTAPRHHDSSAWMPFSSRFPPVYRVQPKSCGCGFSHGYEPARAK
jgi:hypothetical protein